MSHCRSDVARLVGISIILQDMLKQRQPTRISMGSGSQRREAAAVAVEEGIVDFS